MPGAHLNDPVASYVASDDISYQRLAQLVADVQMGPEIPLGPIR